MFNWGRIPGGCVAEWSLDLPLGEFSRHDVFRLRQACEGTLILGSTGSGKSSGAARFLMLWMLRAGFGGLVLCVKPSDRADIEGYAKQCGRENDLVIFGPNEPHRMNLLDLELSHGGGEKTSRLENVVQLFEIILEIAEKNRAKSGGSSGENKYFERAALQLLRSALLPLALAEEPITLENIHRFILSAPRTIDEVHDVAWREKSYCYRILCQSDDRPLSASQLKDFELSLLYWTRDYAGMDGKPRSSIISTYTTMTDLFQRGVIRDTFFSDTTVTPDACRNGKIIVLDFPTLRWNETGRIIQAAFKFVWQRAAERHDVDSNPRPVFLFSDEAQTFLTSFDAPFQATARSSRVATVYVTQNLPGMYEAVGGESARHAVDSLLGNLRLKLFHGQDDPVTCQWQSELIGQTKRLMFSSNSQSSPDQAFDFFQPRKHQSAGFSESWEPEIQSWEWSSGLRNGGAANHFLVDAVAFQGGRLWNVNGKSYLPVTFDQRKE